MKFRNQYFFLLARIRKSLARILRSCFFEPSYLMKTSMVVLMDTFSRRPSDIGCPCEASIFLIDVDHHDTRLSFRRPERRREGIARGSSRARTRAGGPRPLRRLRRAPRRPAGRHGDAPLRLRLPADHLAPDIRGLPRGVRGRAGLPELQERSRGG